MTDQRKLKNVEYFKILGKLTTNNAILYVKMNLGFPCKINIEQEKVAFCSTLDLNCEDKSSIVKCLGHSFCCVETGHLETEITHALKV